jgi:hypothetical protein
VTMTPRERLFRWLDGRPVDRNPAWLLFPYSPIGCYVDIHNHAGYRRVFEASKGRAVMLNRRSPHAPLFSPDVVISKETTVEDGAEVTRQRYRYGGAELVSQTRKTSGGVTRKRLLTTDEDLEILLSFPIEQDPTVIDRELEKQMPQYLADRDDFPEDYGAMMLCLGEPIGFLYSNTDLETYAIWSLTHTREVQAFLDNAMVRMRAIYDFALRRNLAEVYFLIGSELASPPLVNRETFQQWIVPYARTLVDDVHAHGQYAIQHYHGQIGEILPDFLTMGADALHTIEEPPIGDCTLEQAFDVVGDQLGLIGCIQYDCFRSMTPQEMTEAVHDQLRQLEGRRFMLSPSAGPYEPDPDDRVIENYLAFLDAACD